MLGAGRAPSDPASDRAAGGPDNFGCARQPAMLILQRQAGAGPSGRRSEQDVQPRTAAGLGAGADPSPAQAGPDVITNMELLGAAAGKDRTTVLILLPIVRIRHKRCSGSGKRSLPIKPPAADTGSCKGEAYG